MPTTAGEVLTHYLAQQLAGLREQEPLVRQDLPDSVHQMRMSARRLRSLLATGKKFFDDGAAVPEVREELKWLSGVLGAARDPEVIHQRLRDLLAREPDALVFGPVARQIDEELESASAAGRAAALEALNGDRYARLIASLQELVTLAPLTDKAGRKPHKAMLKLIAKDAARVRRRVHELPDVMGSPAHDGPTRDAGLHEVRKAAKRLRYAAEAAGPVAGKKAAKTAKGAHELQQILGLHQDSVVARTLLADLGSRAHRNDAGTGDGRPGAASSFTYGRLHAKEEALAANAEASFRKAWKKFSRLRAGD
ncbi:CHAD domain-containing protein [Arthrobacter sp. PvP023]|uniref:CHAD domain-containing protein n=1 Tax=Micrococcaceae TaxID=1268 RepID=UPI001AE9B489|nr:CHAD domain-containing protein [Arthrobacter sp. PvP023]MBP1134823.1 CHAD domain-containing protein [Arthrobacter sp. PvP023]